MLFFESVRRLCVPSFIYLCLATVVLILALFKQQASGVLFRAKEMIEMTIHVITTLFWTWILNLICKDGFTWLSWALVLAPFALTGLSYVTRAGQMTSVSVL
jgi:hypothetical protein